MKIELTRHEIDVVLFDLPKLIEYYTDLLGRPEDWTAEFPLADEDEPDGNRARTWADKTVLKNPRFSRIAPEMGGGIKHRPRPGKSILGNPRGSGEGFSTVRPPGGGHKPPEEGSDGGKPVLDSPPPRNYMAYKFHPPAQAAQDRAGNGGGYKTSTEAPKIASRGLLVALVGFLGQAPEGKGLSTVGPVDLGSYSRKKGAPYFRGLRKKGAPFLRKKGAPSQ